MNNDQKNCIRIKGSLDEKVLLLNKRGKVQENVGLCDKPTQLHSARMEEHKRNTKWKPDGRNNKKMVTSESVHMGDKE
jgi:hypothetical protein